MLMSHSQVVDTLLVRQEYIVMVLDAVKRLSARAIKDYQSGQGVASLSKNLGALVDNNLTETDLLEYPVQTGHIGADSFGCL